MRRHQWLLLTVLAVCSACDGGEWRNDALASGNYADYFVSCPGVVLTAENGKNFLVIPKGFARAVTSLPVKVEPLTRYRLDFEARVDGPHVVEEVPMYQSLFFETHWWKAKKGRQLASWRILFLDSRGNQINPGFDPFFNTIMTQRLRPYSEEFRTPPGCVNVVFAFDNANPEDALSVGGVTLTTIENPPTVNINPDFSLGADNYSGLNDLKRGRLIPDPSRPGKFFLDFTGLGGGGGRGDFIPVNPGERYRIEYKFQRSPSIADGSARLIVFYYRTFEQRGDSASGQVSHVFSAGAKMSEGQYAFVVPEQMRFMRPYFEAGRFEYIRIIPEAAGETTP